MVIWYWQLLLAGVCLLLAISVCRLIGRERIVITPPVVNQAFWVEAQAVSPEYLSQMASFLAQLRLNLTPVMRLINKKRYCAIPIRLITVI